MAVWLMHFIWGQGGEGHRKQYMDVHSDGLLAIKI